MKRCNKELNKISLYSSLLLMIGITFIWLLSYGCFIFMVSIKPLSLQALEKPWILVALIIMFIVFPTVTFPVVAPRAYSRVELNAEGIKISLFNKFCKRQFSWEEIKEIKFYVQIVPFIFFSKAETLKGLYYDKIVKRKDVITVQLSSKLYKAIKKFTDKPIDNLPDKIIKQLEK